MVKRVKEVKSQVKSGIGLIRGTIFHIGSGTLLVGLVIALLAISVLAPAVFVVILRALGDISRVVRGA